MLKDCWLPALYATEVTQKKGWKFLILSGNHALQLRRRRATEARSEALLAPKPELLVRHLTEENKQGCWFKRNAHNIQHKHDKGRQRTPVYQFTRDKG